MRLLLAIMKEDSNLTPTYLKILEMRISLFWRMAVPSAIFHLSLTSITFSTEMLQEK